MERNWGNRRAPSSPHLSAPMVCASAHRHTLIRPALQRTFVHWRTFALCTSTPSSRVSEHLRPAHQRTFVPRISTSSCHVSAHRHTLNTLKTHVATSFMFTLVSSSTVEGNVNTRSLTFFALCYLSFRYFILFCSKGGQKTRTMQT